MSCHSRLRTFLGSFLGLGLSTVLLISCGGSDSSSTSTTAPAAATGTTVQVSATATDPDGDQLHYRWAVTDGTINNVDAPKTTWTVPPGSGLQFAYVLVSDGKGGYSESRAAAMTFGQVVPTTTTAIPTPPPTTAPNYIWGTLFFKGTTLNRNVYLSGVTVRISRLNEPDRIIETDKKGEFFFSGLSVGGNPYSLFYTIPGRTEQPFTQPISFNPSSPRSYIQQEVNLTGTLQVAGTVRLFDKSHCGVRDEFFTDFGPTKPNALKGPVSATAQLLTSTNGPLSASFPVNHYGDYLIVRSALGGPTSAKVRIHCEQGNDKDSTLFNVQSDLSKAPAVVLDNSRPEIKSMTVLLNGQDVGRPDLPTPRTLFPKFVGDPITFPDTDLIAEIAHTPGDDAFLAYKGLDTRKSACAYYRALGAVEGCDPISGIPTGAQLTLDQWKQRFNLSPFPTGNPLNPRDPGTQEVRIIFINRADLNFARDMQAVRLSDGSIAYNVCNYAGPQNTTGLGEPVDIGTEQQPNINLAIENARRGIGMVACVAMDYSITPGINSNEPFTKFYTFGPSGKLLLSVSLDGRREKFMPGSCTACHGGDFYGGRYPDDGSGRPDMGSRWQPFDMANLDFSEAQKLDMAPVEAAIKQLNQMMVPLANGGLPPVPGATIDITPVTKDRTKELINGWYGGGTLTNQNTAFVPSLYCPTSGGTAPCGQSDLYQKVAQGMCQTCHAAQKLDEQFPGFKNMLCGSTGSFPSEKLADNHTMPNALVPFERFWRDSSVSSRAGCEPVPATHPPL